MKPYTLTARRITLAHPWREAPHLPKKLPQVISPMPAGRMMRTYHGEHFGMNPDRRWRDGAERVFSDGDLETWRAFTERLDALYTSVSEENPVIAPISVEEMALCLYMGINSGGSGSAPYLAHELYHHLLGELPPEARLPWVVEALDHLEELKTHRLARTPNRTQRTGVSEVEQALAFALRRELCEVDAQTYENVREGARGEFDMDRPHRAIFLALLFPEQTEWSHAIIEALIDNEPGTPWHDRRDHIALFHCAAHPEMLCKLAPHLSEETRASWMHIVHDLMLAHGEHTWPVFAALLTQIPGMITNKDIQKLILKIPGEPVIAPMLRALTKKSYINDAPRRKLLEHARDFPDIVVEVTLGLIETNTVSGMERLLEELLDRARHTLDARQNLEARVVVEAIPDALARMPWHTGALRKPRLPRFWKPEQYQPLRLRKTPWMSLSDELRDDIARLLMVCEHEAARPALDALRAWVDETSLGQLCGTLTREWELGGRSAKHLWVIRAFLLCGGQTMVEEFPALLTRLGKRHVAAITDMLEEVDATEHHIELLDVMSEAMYEETYIHAAHKRLGKLAQAHFVSDAHVADLLDARTPWHDLSTSREMVLDEGAHIEVTLDVNLEPSLRDLDVSALTPAQALHWELVQGRLQRALHTMRRRFEHALTTQRRWIPQRWHDHIVAHPLLSGMAQRLLWCSFDEHGTAVAFWRLDESRERVDIEDEPLVANEASIGLAHPMFMDEDQLARWQTLFGDYEIIEPFAQLTRRCVRQDEEIDWNVRYANASAPHEQLHQRIFMRNNWKILPLPNQSGRYPGYTISLPHIDGEGASIPLKLLVHQLYRDLTRRPELHRFERLVNVGRIDWSKVDPIARSELIVSLDDAFGISSSYRSAHQG